MLENLSCNGASTNIQAARERVCTESEWETVSCQYSSQGAFEDAAAEEK